MMAASKKGRPAQGRRIRSLKPELTEDEWLSTLPYKARWLFVCAITLADDFGRFDASFGYIKRTVFWGDLASEEELASLKVSLSRSVVWYSANGRPLGAMRNWEKHQRVDNASEAKWPAPSAAEMEHVEDFRGGSETVPGLSPRNDPETNTFAAGWDRMGWDGIGSKIPPNPPEGGQLGLVEPEPVEDEPPVRSVYEHWVAGWQKHHPKSGRKPILDGKRRRLVQARLRDGYSVDDLKRAIDGLWASEWHVDKAQTDLALVCRDAPHVDQFIARAPEAEPESAPIVWHRKRDEPPADPVDPEVAKEHLARLDAIIASKCFDG
jgi:hypothetical protein